MDLFYNEILDLNSKLVKFTGEEFHHITKVMRYEIDEKIFVTNGRGLIAQTKIISISKIDCVCEIEEIKVFDQPKRKLIALFPLLRNQERFEFAVEKLTELGINEIYPYFSDRTIKKNFRFDRTEKIIISAIKQSFNPFLPIIHKLVSLENFLHSYQSTDLILFGDPKGKNLYQIFDEVPEKSFDRIIITVGPEGGFSEKDLVILKSKNGIGVSLDQNRLRSETAIICLLAQLNLILKK